MEERYFTDTEYERKDFLTAGEYENCTFIRCELANADLSGYKFTDCVFTGCNLSLAKLHKTVFRDVNFRDCKMQGLLFETCSEFGLSFSFDNCQLSNSVFYKTKIRKTVFTLSQVKEVDFTEADLTGVVFDRCDLSLAVFDHTMLEKADFRTAYNYSINPAMNQLKKARFSISGLPGLLHQYDIQIED